MDHSGAVYTLAGVVLYMINDLQFSFIGLMCMLINMVAAVGENSGAAAAGARPGRRRVQAGPRAPHQPGRLVLGVVSANLTRRRPTGTASCTRKMQ